ncbi:MULTISPECIES: amidohydrolase family protein [unclassified Aureimonas]|uniref:amidohydrolase family protein n=1 Tax=unclassified Aureimonas TaxID=2615206 RepID=UPI0006F7D7A6|nr:MULTISPECIES: amidohydrolase family protein [unclassified Aureimonas]KQT52447.1 amidohydrolase [Aureimonas sp. Leaf427]KQT77652.1 amidohydrolase [Aureimonas sp. Leaf460]
MSVRPRLSIDSHQHFWQVARGDYGWMGEHVAPLLRDFLPDDLRPHLARAGIDRTILVQAAETEAETDFLLGIAERTDFVAGVVGWLDMEAETFPERLEHYAGNPLFVGLRPMLQGLEDDAFILRPRVLDHLRLVAEMDVAFDILTFPRHLPHVAKALEAVPGLRAVVDHLSKPSIAAGDLDPWRADLAAVAAFPNVSCKVSGMVTEAAEDWRPEAFRPFVAHVADIFGEDRLMFGSDWPVATLAASYAEVGALARTLLGEHFGPAALAKIFGDNAAAFYGKGRSFGAAGS